MTAIADHRLVITNALQPDLPMRLLRRNEGMALYVGLWGVWWGSSDPASVPDGVKVMLATVHSGMDGSPASPDQTTLSALPWIILQLQSISPNDPFWAILNDVLRDEMAALPTDRRCGAQNRKVMFDSSQEVHNMRKVRQPDVLSAYTVRRVDPGSAEASPVRPMSSLYRDRIEYQVFRGWESDLRLQPEVRIFMEHRVPKHQHTSQRLHSETGLERQGDLYAAVESWRTWITLVA